MADKTSFTKEEWTLLLESPMIAGMAITAAEPSGLWGLLKESFAGGTALTRAVTGADTNALVKSVVTDFSSGEGRSAARDGAPCPRGRRPDASGPAPRPRSRGPFPWRNARAARR